ncbi:MAG: invasion associated locus B family protein [Pseudomonadota bacterium]
MFRPFRFVLPAVFSLLALPAAAQQENEVRDTIGAWDIVCQPGTDACVMQQVGKSAQGEDTIMMRITKVNAEAENGQVVPAVTEIFAPLGVVLTAGLRVQVDGGQVRGTAFVICLANGCLAQDSMSEEFINDLKRGNSAKMLLVQPGAGEIGVNISLSGFTKAYNSLKAVAPTRRQ